MAVSLVAKLPVPNTPLLNANGSNLNYVWYEFIRTIATEARTSDTDGGLRIVGNEDEVQLEIVTYSTQTANIVEIKDPDNNAIFTIDFEGDITAGVVNGRNLEIDGAKLDGIEAGANLYVHPDHFGDVASLGDGGTTINPNVVDNEKLSNVPEKTIKGRQAGSGTGDPEDLTDAQACATILSGTALTSVSVSVDDKVIVQDTSDDDNVKTVTAQDIADLGAGAPILVATVTASASAAVEFTGLTTGYHTYLISISNMLPATDTANLQLQMGDGTYDAGASDYMWLNTYDTLDSGGSTSSSRSGDFSDSKIVIAANLSSDSTDEFSALIWISNPLGNKPVHVKWHTSYEDSGDTWVSATGSGKHINNVEADQVRFIMSSGNIAAGTFKLYGLRNA